MSNKRFIQAYIADGAITARYFVKPADADNEVSVAAASTDNVIGVADVLDKVSGETVDVVLTGAPDVKFGGTVTRGQRVMSSAAGKAVAYVQTMPVLKRVAGGAAGDITVTGIKAADTLISVLHHTTGGAVVDLTSEFSVTADDTINNAAGTATTSDSLIVMYMPALQNVPVGRAKVSAVDGDIGPVILGLN